MERIKAFVLLHKTAILTLGVVLLVGIAYAVGRYSADERTVAEKPAVMTQEVKALRNQLDISRTNAEALRKRLAEVQMGRHTPAAPITYNLRPWSGQYNR